MVATMWLGRRISRPPNNFKIEASHGFDTNREAYPDGNQIHAPFSVPKGDQTYLSCIGLRNNEEYSNGAIQIPDKNEKNTICV